MFPLHYLTAYYTIESYDVITLYDMTYFTTFNDIYYVIDAKYYELIKNK
jgi:hypothetical protein